MTILIIHQHFCLPSEGGGIRSYHVAKALANAGHEIHVVSGNSHSSFTSTQEGFRLYGLAIPYKNSFSFLRRSFAFLHFMITAYRCALKLPKADVVYAISTPLSVGYIGMKLKQKLHTKLVFEVGDLWPDAPIAIGALRNKLIIHWLANIENSIYRNSDLIIALSPDIEEVIRAKSPAYVVVTVPNMSDMDFFRQSIKHESSTFTIGYFGSFGIANQLEYLIDAAQESKKSGLSISFVMMGDGGRYLHIAELIKEKRLDNIELCGWGDKNAVAKRMALCDAIYVSFKDLPVLAKGSPNKFFDGLAAGKIIISNFEGWIGELIKKHEIGFCYPPERPDLFVTNITKYLNNATLCATTSQNALKLAHSVFELNQLSQQIVRRIEKL